MKRNFMMEPESSSSEGRTTNRKLKRKRAESPPLSCVSVKSDHSMGDPPTLGSEVVTTVPMLQTHRAASPPLSCVSMKSDHSMGEPPKLGSEVVTSVPTLQTHRAASPPLSSVSIKSDHSMGDPPSLGSEVVTTVPTLQTHRAASPLLSCVSIKSDHSMGDPPSLGSEVVTTVPTLKRKRAASPPLSCVSMKSDHSMGDPPTIGSKVVTTVLTLQTQTSASPAMSYMSVKSDRSMGDPSESSSDAAASNLMLDKARSEITALVNESVVDIMNKRQQKQKAASLAFNSVSMKSEQSLGDPPTCSSKAVISAPRKTTTTTTRVIGTGALQQNYVQHVDDILSRVLKIHKNNMKIKHEILFEGIRTQENRTLLDRVYTELYIIENENVREEHEILQMEKTHSKHLYDTPIDCNEIFKCLLGARSEKDQAGELKTVLTKGIAGIGKTVSVQKFILDWAEGKANHDVLFMFVLPFRELNLIKDEQYSLHELLCDFYPELKDLDPKLYDVHKVLFIFDGLDESKVRLNFSNMEKVSDTTTKSSVHVLMTNLIKGELLPLAQIWITSRPAAANQIPPQYIGRVTEIQGFSDLQKKKYFRKRISDQDQAEKILSHIKAARSLHIMCHIPVFCWISATVLQQIWDADIPKTLTEMYIHFLLIQMNIKKEKYGKSNTSNPNKQLGSDRETILKLAKLAYKQLLKGNIMFYEEDLKECGIDVIEASVCSGICTEIFREESVLYQRKVYCFVHLSFQEFLAAFYVFHCYMSKNMEELQFFKPQYRELSEHVSLEELLEEAVRKALQCKNGHLDLFLRFLLGISLESNQKLLHGLLTHIENSSESISKIISLIQKKIKSEDKMDIEMSMITEIWKLVTEKINQKKCLPADRSINLFLCLTEMNDQSLSGEIQDYLKSEKFSEKKLSPGHCSALACMLLISEEVLDELDLRKYNTSEEGCRRLIPAVRNCRKALLAGCNLSMNAWEILTSTLQSENSSLKELDLSNNMLQDSGVELLSTGLKSSHCKLQIFRLASCNLTTSSCDTLCSTLKSENSCLTELDISNNHLQDSGVEKLSEGLISSLCKLQILRLAGCNLSINSCKHLCSALTSANPSLKELDLKNNDLQDSGVNLLSDGLKSTRCKLEILGLSGCMITEVGCSSLASALSSNPLHLKELDLTYNHPEESGVRLLSARKADPHCSLTTLRVEHGGENRIKPGLKKYSCEFTLDPNTAYRALYLSDEDKKVANMGSAYSYQYYPERFDYWEQILSRERVTGCCYWEAEWSGKVNIAVIYESISRKGGTDDCLFGNNEKSWILICSDDSYSVRHNNNVTELSTTPSGCKRVGVYVDYPAGTLSFYRVSSDQHTLTHLHTFYTSFTETLYAGFWVGYNSSVCLI